jgi:tRNA-binding EMAP/Myf-like protein
LKINFIDEIKIYTFVSMKEQITFPEFLEFSGKLEIKTGEILKVEEVPKSKLTKMTVDFGNDEFKISLTNIKEYVVNGMESLIGKKFLFITNLKPTIIKGIESQAMILPGEIESNNFIQLESSLGIELL